MSCSGADGSGSWSIVRRKYSRTSVSKANVFSFGTFSHLLMLRTSNGFVPGRIASTIDAGLCGPSACQMAWDLSVVCTRAAQILFSREPISVTWNTTLAPRPPTFLRTLYGAGWGVMIMLFPRNLVEPFLVGMCASGGMKDRRCSLSDL
jgi:hypothetical protein